MTTPTFRKALATCFLSVVFATTAFAQPGGPRGSSRGGFGGPGGPPGGGRGGPTQGGFGRPGGSTSSNPSDRFFGFLDRNRDGKLDGDEMRRLPGPMREAFEKSKIDVRNGISRDDFNRSAPRMFEDMRRRREEERGSDRGRDDRDRDRDRGRDDRDQSKRDKKDTGNSRSFQAAKRDRVTIDLPSSYTAGDENSDGQLTLLEWRTWKGRKELMAFVQLDRNRDGLLTPAELTNPNTTPIASSSPPARRERTRVTSRSTSPAASSTPTLPKSGTLTSSSSVEREANSAFSTIDNYGNKDGKINPVEWKISRTIKPVFEKGGADLTKDMDNAEFVRVYLKVFPKGRPKRR